MTKVRLSPLEEEIEKDLLEGNYKLISNDELIKISESIKKRKKDSVISLRINSIDLNKIKKKAKELGVKYQTFISEILHKVAL